MQDLQGRTAVVTGAGGAIGRSIAMTLAEVGMNVVVVDIDGDCAQAVQNEINVLGVDSRPLSTDVSRLEEVQHLADEAFIRFGAVDILVNNAGVTLRPVRASWDLSYKDMQRIMAVNFWGTLHGHHTFVPRTRMHPGDKHIVNTSSVVTLKASPGHAAYPPSKGAVDGFSLAAARELATQNIGLTLLYPARVRRRIPTSERVRPPEHRSDSRSVKPWSSYVDAPADVEPALVGYVEPAQLARYQEVFGPDHVGPLVVDALRGNRLYCPKHPIDVEAMPNRLSAIASSYRSGARPHGESWCSSEALRRRWRGTTSSGQPSSGRRNRLLIVGELTLADEGCQPSARTPHTRRDLATCSLPTAHRHSMQGPQDA